MNQIFEDAVKIIDAHIHNEFPVIIAGAAILSLEHIQEFAHPVFRKAKLVRRKTKVGNEVQDDIPLGKIYEVGPSAFYFKLGECAYTTEDGWIPCELLELI